MSYKPVIRLSFGDETFDLVKIMASEISKIRLWTEIGSKTAWMDALVNEDIEAWKAAYTLMKQRAGSDLRFSDVDFDTDNLGVEYVDPPTGRPVMICFAKDEAGGDVLDRNEQPVPLTDDRGRVLWQFSDDETLVPFDPDPTTTSPPTPGTSGSSSASAPGTPATLSS